MVVRGTSPCVRTHCLRLCAPESFIRGLAPGFLTAHLSPSRTTCLVLLLIVSLPQTNVCWGRAQVEPRSDGLGVWFGVLELGSSVQAGGSLPGVGDPRFGSRSDVAGFNPAVGP